MSSLPSRARALAQLHSGHDALLLARMGAFAAAVPVMMRLPLPRLAALVTRPPGATRPPDSEIERLERLIGLAPTVAYPLVRTGCLTRGVTLFWFLRRAGLDVELRFGLDPSETEPTDGHCWLTLDDQPFLEKRDPRPRFAEIYRIPVPAA